MTTLPGTNDPLSLANCDREPIHIPGSIQPHGVLIALDRDARIICASVNAEAMLGLPSSCLSQVLGLAHVGGNQDVLDFILDAVAQAASGDLHPCSMEVALAGKTFDLVVHQSAELAVCEFEQRSQGADQLATFAQKAYRMMDGIKRQRTVDKLLEAAAHGVREITGFDRVMAYRFRHDDSGDVVAEARRDDMEPYVGRRYPASDIPQQARRLYVLNTLRLISDVAYEPVPLAAVPSRTEPLDLSFSVLRSVSPIHVEYLRNMGVAASMSVSIVVGGRLWGMIACHHLSPLQVPHSVRMAADVMAQVLASSVQSLTAQSREAEVTKAAWLRTDATSHIAKGEDTFDVLAKLAPNLQDILRGHAIVVTLEGRRHVHGEVDGAWLDKVLDHLNHQSRALLQFNEAAQLPGLCEETDGKRYCGLLGLRFDAPRDGWLLALRLEQIETIRWGGKPEKDVTHGPLGPRLTPRGSFDEWRETVRGTSEPWSATEMEIASQFLDSVSRAHAERVLEIDQLRSQLWAVLGHDLRNPLQSLSMASRVLDMGADKAGRASRIIRNSTDRMESLLRDILDVSRLQNGLALDLNVQEHVNVAQVVRQLLEECQSAHPTTVIRDDVPWELRAKVDAGRFSQVVANLLSNARQHSNGEPVDVSLSQGDDGRVLLKVGNVSQPIPEDIASTLFNPFNRKRADTALNRTGMGLGLYIASQVARGHGGEIHYRAGEGKVWFEVVLPKA